eukprot:TRINITY_DN6084_c0_g1_i1.p1 TRINITY_DN6084_c0_g1~~TRINITY_DN6084_c0_g1_i1.p1  ORF type:complete len:257 (-),score=41.77 TRINITY_DN6084_c0_g1_i1:25-795(-)
MVASISESSETSTQRIQRELKALIDLEFEIQEDIAELRECFSTSLKDRQEMNIQIKERIRHLSDEITALQDFAEELDDEKEKESLMEKLESHFNEEEKLTATLRKANITAMLNLQKAIELERKTLLEGGENAVKMRQSKTRQDIVRASQELTDTLTRIRHRMHSETQKTSDTLTELARSSRGIGDIMNEHDDVASSIRQGKGMLSKLKRRDFTDRLLIVFGFIFFLLVVFYVVKSRLNITFFGLLSEGTPPATHPS